MLDRGMLLHGYTRINSRVLSEQVRRIAAAFLREIERLRLPCSVHVARCIPKDSQTVWFRLGFACPAHLTALCFDVRLPLASVYTMGDVIYVSMVMKQ